MQNAIQVLYQGYSPVTNMLIVENPLAEYAPSIKKQPLGRLSFVFIDMDQLKKSCPGLPPGITGCAGTSVGRGSEEGIAHF